MANGKRVAVIGAGVAGLCSIKSCLEEGFEPFCFERHGDIGGVWHYTEEHREGQGARMYNGLITNVSKGMFAFSDFPFPRDAPLFLHHKDMIHYLNDYCDHFGLRQYIHLNTKVTNVYKADDHESSSRWMVETKTSKGPSREMFDFVMVCPGTFHVPLYPDIPGLELFQGSMEHSMTFTAPEKYAGKRVLVIGNGNSGADIASMPADYASKVYLSVGEGMIVVPRTVKDGMPYDYFLSPRVISFNQEKLFKCAEKMGNYCLDHKKAGLTFTGRRSGLKICIHDHLKIQIFSGKVKIVPRVTRFGPSDVEFEDGTTLSNIDCVIFCTGFGRKMDFLNEDAKGCTGTDTGIVNLYKMVFPLLSKHNLALIGMTNSDGAFPPIAELQSRFAAAVFAEKITLPSKEQMQHDIDLLNQHLIDRFGKIKYSVILCSLIRDVTPLCAA